jgi:hypothetical protein
VKPAEGDRQGRADETGVGFVTAWAEMGSASSRNRVGRRHNVRLSSPTRSVIVVAGISETAARRAAEAINELLDEALCGPGREPVLCAHCSTPMPASGLGRPAIYCSQACRQQAYRDRRRP